MKIGLTFDLRSWYLAQGYGEEETAEFDREDTVEALERTIRGLGYETERIGSAFQLVEALARGRRWDLVFNIAEGLHGPGREALVPALLDAYRIPYVFSDPLVLALSLDKAACKRFVRDLGLPTPDFTLVREPCDIAGIDLPYPLFAKPNAEGTGKGVSPASKIGTPEELEARCLELLREFRQPVLVETYLPGREFTVGVVGTGAAARVPGGMEVVYRAGQDAIYSYATKKDYEELVDYRPIEEALMPGLEALSLAVWRGLGCRDGGRIDLRLDARGRPSFIEVNPLAGLHPTISDLPILCRMQGIDYPTLIGAILESAMKRLGAPACG